MYSDASDSGGSRAAAAPSMARNVSRKGRAYNEMKGDDDAASSNSHKEQDDDDDEDTDVEQASGKRKKKGPSASQLATQKQRRFQNTCMTVSLLIFVVAVVGAGFGLAKVVGTLVPMARNLDRMAQNYDALLTEMHPQLYAWRDKLNDNVAWLDTVRGSINKDRLAAQLQAVHRILNTTQALFTAHIEPRLAQWTQDVDHVLDMSSALDVVDVHHLQHTLQAINALLDAAVANIDHVPVEQTMAAFNQLVALLHETSASWKELGGFAVNLALNRPGHSLSNVVQAGLSKRDHKDAA